MPVIFNEATGRTEVIQCCAECPNFTKGLCPKVSDFVPYKGDAKDTVDHRCPYSIL